MPGPLRRHALPVAGLALLALALFARVLHFDFVHYDDYELLVVHQDALARPGFVVASLWRDAFAMLGPDSQGIFYRPVLIASHGLEAQLGRPDPALFHATNLALHLLATLLAYALFVAFGCGRALAFALAAVFCCHPASALVVAWIPCRNESLLAITCLASELALLRYLDSGGRGSLVLCLAAWAVSLFTKETGVALLAALVATAALAPGGHGRRRELVVALVAALAIGALWAALRGAVLGGPRLGVSRAPGNLSGLLVYLGKTFAPLGLAPVPDPADTALWPGALALIGLAIAVAGAHRRLRGPAGIGLVWYAAFLLPSLSVPRETWGLEHRLYLPLIGMLLFVSQLVGGGARRQRLGVAALLVVAALCATLTLRRLPDYSGPIAFWEAALRDSPHSAFAASRLPWRYFEASRFEDAIAAADRALALDPRPAHLHLVRGTAAANLGDWPLALRDLELFVAQEPGNVEAWQHLASVQERLGLGDASRESRRRAAALQAR